MAPIIIHGLVTTKVLPQGFGFEVDPKPQDQHRSWARYLVRSGYPGLVVWEGALVVVGGTVLRAGDFQDFFSRHKSSGLKCDENVT